MITRNIILAGTGALALLTVAASGHADSKEELCHTKSDGSSSTIRVSGSSLSKHLAHGDSPGECESDYGDDSHDGSSDPSSSRNRDVVLLRCTSTPPQILVSAVSSTAAEPIISAGDGCATAIASLLASGLGLERELGAGQTESGFLFVSDDDDD